jgi:hypothetical protein
MSLIPALGVLGGRHTRAAWSTEQVLGQPGLHRETLMKEEEEEEEEEGGQEARAAGPGRAVSRILVGDCRKMNEERESWASGPLVLRDSAPVIARDCSTVPRGLCSGPLVPSGKPPPHCMSWELVTSTDSCSSMFEI